MHTITELKTKEGVSTGLIAVKVPKDASEFSLQDDDDFEHTGLMFFLEKGASGIALPYNTYSILGLVTDSTIGFDCENFLDKKLVSNIEADGYWYKAYKADGNNIWKVTSDASFRSLLAVNNLYLKNPLSQPKPKETLFGVWDMDRYFKEFTEWQQAESNLLADSILLILKKL